MQTNESYFNDLVVYSTSIYAVHIRRERSVGMGRSAFERIICVVPFVALNDGVVHNFSLKIELSFKRGKCWTH